MGLILNPTILTTVIILTFKVLQCLIYPCIVNEMLILSNIWLKDQLIILLFIVSYAAIRRQVETRQALMSWYWMCGSLNTWYLHIMSKEVDPTGSILYFVTLTFICEQTSTNLTLYCSLVSFIQGVDNIRDAIPFPVFRQLQFRRTTTLFCLEVKLLKL